MNNKKKAEEKRKRRAARGPGFSAYAKRNVSDPAAFDRDAYSEDVGQKRAAAVVRQEARAEKTAGIFHRLFGRRYAPVHSRLP